ncbi:MAG: ABC transporter substrate-binding protein [Actinomycetota bacterium]
MATRGAPARTAVLATVLVLAGVACSSSSDTGPRPSPSGGVAFPLTMTDDDGTSVTLQHPARRIVTFGPSITEVVFALGVGDRLVGVSGKSDDHPAAARSIEEIGGSGEFGVDPNVEKVLSLHPDLFLTISGGEEWKKRLRQLGVPVFTVNATTFPDALHDIETVGRLTGTDEEAAKLADRLRRNAGLIERSVASLPKVTCFFEEGYGPPVYTVGPGSFIFDLLKRAGCTPITAGARTAYPQWSVEALVHADPNAYLVDSESGGSIADVGRRPGFHSLTSVREGRVYLVNGDLVARPGPRIVEGLAEMAKDIHPEAFG